MQRQTDQLCRIVSGVRFEALDETTVAKVKQAIIDGIAVAIAGSTQKPIVLLAQYAHGLGCAPAATVWGHGFRSSAAAAAGVNAAAAHVLDYEPMSSPSTHAVSPVVPVAFALAETERLPGRELIAACAKGIEVQHRILFSASQQARAERRFHPPGVVGVIGAAVAAAHMIGLDALQLRNALGIAASRAGALRANAGTMTKCTHAGNAASAGLEAAILAKRGFTASAEVLEAADGFVAAFFSGGTFDYTRLLQFGKPYRIVEPGMAYKFFPSKYPTQFAVSAALDLRKAIADPKRIARVRLTTPAMRDVDRPQPVSGLDGKFSFQYTTAVALLDGVVRIDSFTDARRFRADVAEFLPKIHLTQSQSIPTDFRRMHVEMEVETSDGARHATVCSTPKGFWGAEIRAEDHAAKLYDCLGQVFAAGQIERIIALVARLEQLEAGDTAELIGLLGNKPVVTALRAGT